MDGAKRVQAQTVRTALDEDCNGEQGQDPGFAMSRPPRTFAPTVMLRKPKNQTRAMPAAAHAHQTP